MIAESIVVSSDDPELFDLVQLLKKNPDMKQRLLAYAKKLSEM